MFFYLVKLLFSDFLPFKGDFVRGQKKRKIQNTVTELLLKLTDTGYLGGGRGEFMGYWLFRSDESEY